MPDKVLKWKFIGGVFQFHHHQRQTVDEQDDIRALGIVIFQHRKLVDGQEFVVLRVGKVDQPDLVGSALPLADAVFDVHAIGQQTVECLVVVDDGGESRAKGTLAGFFAGIGRDVRVQAVNGGSQTTAEDDVGERTFR